ncbi:hypothetical protein SAMD00019534_016050 [Acytostelium subglobosum LB1]|uniref:hypothetical protein n=1 Tax=Acytostelium subglobosum LB1 TaxID=1410327 RepID=UPI000644B044|nr:hypothetical protein SAMD00019534_016050 [Acytostelium subglobosum LB1]GAM18430.1 hypothetical protein SAMD00019534_016050 [Acytostelium subglobosum LB1]|eukprot:XP_012757650.1 hypothetical protein SAMD00019534_016050 [Acytostelium subglobosum LB1]
MVNDTNVANVSESTMPDSVSMYTLGMVNLTQYANGNNYTLAFKYVQGSQSNNTNKQTQFLIDYINLISTTSNLIDSDVYVSNVGSDVSGNGMIDNPFYSVQYAINVIESGNSINLLTDVNLIRVQPGATYLLDTIGKNITIQSAISSTSVMTLINNYTNTLEPTPTMIVTGYDTTLSNIMIQGGTTPLFGQAGVLTQPPNTNLLMDNVIQYGAQAVFNPTPADMQAPGIIFAQYNTTTIINNCTFSGNQGQGMFLHGSIISLFNTTFSNNHGGTLISFSNTIMDIQLLQCRFVNNANLLTGQYFDRFLAADLYATNNAIGDNIDSLENGNMVNITRCLFMSNTYALNFYSLNSVTINGTTMQSSTIPQSGLLTFIQVYDGLVLTNNHLTGTLSTGFPAVVTTMTTAYLQNNLFDFNHVTLFECYNSNVTLYNDTISYNDDAMALLEATECALHIANATISYNLSPLLTMSMSQVTLMDSLLLENSNENYWLVPFITMERPTATLLLNNLFQQNFNFILLRIRGADSVVMDSQVFTSNYIGPLITAYDGTCINITNMRATDNFLATNFPLVIESSKLTMRDSIFIQNTQALMLSNSTFDLRDCTWDHIYSVNSAPDQSFVVQSSNGSIFGSTFSNANPNIGIYTSLSHLRLESVIFMELSGYDNPLGHFYHSTLDVYDCHFKACSAGANMMTSEYTNATFVSCIFFNMSSPVATLLFQQFSEVRFVNTSILSIQGNSMAINSQLSNVSFIDTVIWYTYFVDSFLFVETGVLDAQGLEFSYNQARLRTQDSVISIRDSVLSFNHNQGNLIQIQAGHISIVNSKFENNGSPHTPAVISTIRSEVDIIGSNFTSNNDFYTVVDSYVDVTRGSLYIHGTIFGGLFSNNGTVVVRETSATNIDSSIFRHNFAFAMPGTALRLISNPAVVLTNCQFTDNTNSDSGGAIYLYDTRMWASNVTVVDNFAYRDGGAILAIQSELTFYASTFTLNIAQNGAGAVCYSDTPTCYIGNCTDDRPCPSSGNSLNNTFKDNSVQNGYGAYMATGPKSLDIRLIEDTGTIHPNTTFLLFVSEYDSYEQVVSILPTATSMSLMVYRESDGALLDMFNNINLPQGFFTQRLTINQPVGTALHFMANASNGFTADLHMMLQACDAGQYPTLITNACTQCPINTYGWDGNTCYSCTNYVSNQVRCPGGNNIVTMPGWWRLPDSEPPRIYECDHNVCLLNSCRPHQYGTLCSKCETGYAKVKSFCEECPVEGVNYFLLAGYLLFMFLYVLCLSLYRLPSATALFNLLTCVQMIGVTSFDIRYVTFLPLFNFNVDYWPTTCLANVLTFPYKNIIAFSAIVIVVGLSSRLTIGKDVAARLLRRFVNTNSESKFNNEWHYALFSHVLMVYTPLAFLSLGLVSCYRIGPDYYLSVDVGVQCFSGEHYPLLVAAILVILFILIGAPLYILIKCRRGYSNRYFHKMFLAKYRPRYMWWDIVILLRSICFVVTTITTIYHLDVKSLILSTLSLFFTCITWLCAPYRRKSHNDLETHFGLILCICALVFNSRSLDNSSLLTGLIISNIALLCLISQAYYVYHNMRSKRALTSIERDWGIKSSAAVPASSSSSSSSSNNIIIGTEIK